MKKKTNRLLCFLLAVLMLASLNITAFAEDTDAEVSAVVALLESIDSLQEMQNYRSNFTVSGNYDADSAESVAEHKAAQAGYESYLNEMFAKRSEAKAAYDALTAEQQATIDASLVAKLDDTLENEWYMDKNPTATFPVVEGHDNYIYQVIFPKNKCYEFSTNCTPAIDIPQTIALIDTTKNTDTWVPNGLYSFGESNYEVAYCCDLVYPAKDKVLYKRVNLEDSGYYSEASANHIRAIVQNSYPYVSIEEMKAGLIAGGLDEELVNDLTRGDIISSVQMAIWAYANADYDEILSSTTYGGTFDTKKYSVGTAFHYYNNEMWEWWAPVRNRITYNEEIAYRVNTLTTYLRQLTEVAAEPDEILISKVEVSRTEPVEKKDDLFSVDLKVILNTGCEGNDDVDITVTSYTVDADGSKTVTGTSQKTVGTDRSYDVTVLAKYGDTINVTVAGTQYHGKSVCFYEPEGGRTVSQALVSVCEGETPVSAQYSFELEDDIDMGIRIYKTDNKTGAPISDISFTVYAVPLEEGETVFDVITKEDGAYSLIPDEDDIEKYMVEANKIATIVTDETGYASLELADEGLYLVVEEHNMDKVKAPVDPFFVLLPMEDAETEELLTVIPIYPKNETLEDEGYFKIHKYSANDVTDVLAGAQFQVFRHATAEDEQANIITVTCDGVSYSVVPVVVNGDVLVMTTGEDGLAVSPHLPYGEYFILETKAPEGHKLSEEAVKVTIAKNYTGTAEIVYISNDTVDNLLPETGGIGTFVFYATGSVLVCAAAAALAAVIIKRRRNKVS